jgi:hypothetical protein
MMWKLVANSRPPVAQRETRTDVGMEREEYATLVTRAKTSSAQLRTAPCAALSAHHMIFLCGEKRQVGEGLYASVHELLR